VAETSYASCGDLSLAYQVFGDGPVELVFVGPMVSRGSDDRAGSTPGLNLAGPIDAHGVR